MTNTRVKVKKGQLLVLTSGSHDDYTLDGVFRVTKDFFVKAPKRDSWREEIPQLLADGKLALEPGTELNADRVWTGQRPRPHLTVGIYRRNLEEDQYG